jgi:hypothetical protein
MKPISMAISKSRFGGRWNMLGNRKSWGKHHPKHLANMFFLLKIIYDLREKNLHHWWLFTLSDSGWRSPGNSQLGQSVRPTMATPKDSDLEQLFLPLWARCPYIFIWFTY